MKIETQDKERHDKALCALREAFITCTNLSFSESGLSLENNPNVRHLAYWVLLKKSIASVFARVEHDQTGEEVTVMTVLTAHPCSISSKVLLGTLQYVKYCLENGVNDDSNLTKFFEQVILNLMEHDKFTVGGYRDPEKVYHKIISLLSKEIYNRKHRLRSWVFTDLDGHDFMSATNKDSLSRNFAIEQASIVNQYIARLNQIDGCQKIVAKLLFKLSGGEYTYLSFKKDLAAMGDRIPNKLLQFVNTYRFAPVVHQPRIDACDFRHLHRQLKHPRCYSDTSRWLSGFLNTISKYVEDIPLIVMSRTTKPDDVRQAREVLDAHGLQRVVLVPLVECKVGLANLKEIVESYLDFLTTQNRLSEEIVFMFGLSDITRVMSVLGGASMVADGIDLVIEIFEQRGLLDKLAIHIGVGENIGRQGLTDIEEFVAAYFRKKLGKVYLTAQGDGMFRLNLSEVAYINKPTQTSDKFREFLTVHGEKCSEWYATNVLESKSFDQMMQLSLAAIIAEVQVRVRNASRYGNIEAPLITVLRAIRIGLIGVVHMGFPITALGSGTILSLCSDEDIIFLKEAAKTDPLARHLLTKLYEVYYLADGPGNARLLGLRGDIDDCKEAIDIIEKDLWLGNEVLAKIFPDGPSEDLIERRRLSHHCRANLAKGLENSGGNLPVEKTLKKDILDRLAALLHVYGTGY